MRDLAIRAAATVSLLGLVVLFATGCSPPHLAGTNDAALEYVAMPDLATSASAAPAVLAAGIKARLVSAQIPADVEAALSGERTVRVVVDADMARAADELLRWRGGVSVYRVDAECTLAPPDTTGIRPMSAKEAGGGMDRWWQGSAAAVMRAVRQSALDANHAAFGESLPDGSGEWRTRVVAAPAIAELGYGPTPLASVDAVAHGQALALSLSPGARAALMLERSRGNAPTERVAFVRGTTMLRTMALEDALAGPVVVGFGEGVMAYTRAYRTRQLLRSPVLPPLRRIAARPVPPRWGLAAACAILPFTLSFAWLAFVRRFDRTRPEPMWLVVATFALGGVAIVPAALVELGLARVSPWLDPGLATLGGQPWALPLAIPVFAVSVGLVEEGAKLLSVWSLASRRREFDEPVDGIVYGCAAALGFAAMENVKYFALGRMSGAVIALRAFMTVPAHMFFGALWGYAMGTRLVSRRSSVLAFLAIAALAHGTFDALLSTDGAQLPATLLVLALAVSFFVMLRRTLRHGAVPPRVAAFDEPPATEPVPASMLQRVYFRVGAPRAFFSCSAAMVLCAFALTVLGTAYEFLHHRAGIVFVGLATALLALFGLAAYGASATIPLDVAIDASGITFAGGRTPWSTILGTFVDAVARGKLAVVCVQTRDGTLRLGPTTPEIAHAIAGACANHGG